MTDKLTERLHAVGDHVALAPLPPAMVRANADRRKRTRRLTGAVVAGVMAVLVATALLIANLRSPQTIPISPPDPPTAAVVPAPPPARTAPIEPVYYELLFARDQNVVLVLESNVPSDRPHVRLESALESAIPSERGRCPGSTGNCRIEKSDPGLYVLAPAPGLTGEDLNTFEFLSGYHPDWTDLPGDAGAVPTLTTCFSGPAGLEATQASVVPFMSVTGSIPQVSGPATPMTPADPAYLIETVLKFDDPVAAADAYRSIREQALSCNYSAIGSTPVDVPPVPGWPVEEAFMAEFKPSA